MSDLDTITAMVGATGRDCSCCHRAQPDDEGWAAYQMDVEGPEGSRSILVVLCPKCEETVDALVADGREITIQDFGLIGLEANRE
jgi:hypothetical protein